MRFLIVVLPLFFASFANAQKTDSSLSYSKFKYEELKNIQQKVFYSKKEQERLEANKEFIKLIESVAANKNALQFPFDSLKEISSLSPKNKKFKLITWNIPKDDQTHLFFGFLLVNNSITKKTGLFKKQTTEQYEYYKLVDKSAGIKNPETYIGTCDKWFGMLYYELIENDGYFTLLGWDGNDKLIQRKFIDVLYFKPDGTPVFGKDEFKFPRKNPRRIMFEYSSEVTMSLKYHNKKNAIIYSHLAPREEGDIMNGLPQYYGPDGSYDAMVQKKGKWIIIEDVDAQNDKNKNDSNWNNPLNPKKIKHKKTLPANQTKN
ncbi:MAG: hypothetical protein JNM96_04535 [Bacteroidia bacterium]|nr:hypothetical protein [Bacteroidia bacterium]